MNEKMDNKFREMEANASGTPSAAAWSNIEKSLAGGKSKAFFLYWTMGVLCVAAGIYLAAQNTQDTGEVAQTEPLAAVENHVMEPKANMLAVEDMDMNQDISNASNITLETEKYITVKPVNTPRSIARTTSKSGANKSNTTLGAINEVQIENPSLAESTENNFSQEKEETIEEANISVSPPLVMEEKEIVPTVDLEEEEELGDPCPAMSSKQKKNFFVEGMLFLGSHFKRFENATNESMLLRKDTEKSWYNWGGSIGVGMYLKPNIYVSTHLEYLQQKDLFSFSKDRISRMIVDYDPETGEQLSANTVSGSWTSSGEISRTLIDGSINVGYMFGSKGGRNKWQFGVEPALLYNLSLLSEGKVMLAQDDIRRLEDEALYQSSLGLGYQLHVVATKEMQNGLLLNVKPFYRSYIDQWSSNNADALSIPTLGLKVGLRKVF